MPLTSISTSCITLIIVQKKPNSLWFFASTKRIVATAGASLQVAFGFVPDVGGVGDGRQEGVRDFDGDLCGQ